MTEQVQIDDVVLAVSAPSGFASCLNAFVLWQGPDVRGKDRRIAHRPGAVARRRRADESVRVLELLIGGYEDEDGDPHTNYREGLQANVAYLRSELADPLDDDDPTRTCTLTLPDGTTASGPVIVEALEFAGEGDYDLRATLTLTLVDGALVPDGS